ncbi:MAG: GlsB/YeaQ/YmgE family stress response membrane protein [Acidimicrobiia bacterium]
MFGILWMLLIGLVTGGIARVLVPGKDPMTWWQTMLLGVVGSFVGGFVGSLFPGGRSPLELGPSNIVFSVIGAVIALLVWRRVKRA